MVSEEIIKRRGKTIPNKKPLSVEVRKSIYMLIFTLLTIIILVSIVYLLNSSQHSQLGHALIQEKIIKDNLNEEEQDLVEKTIRSQAYSKIQEIAENKNMIKPEEVMYVD